MGYQIINSSKCKRCFRKIPRIYLENGLCKSCKRIPANYVRFWKSVDSKLEDKMTKEKRKSIIKELRIFAISKALAS